MENNGSIPQLQRKSISLSNSQPSMKTPTTASNNGNNASFVNHGRYFGSLLCLVIMSWSSVFQMWEVENLVCSEWEGLPLCAALTLWTERGQECAGSQQHSRPQESGEPLIRYSRLLLDVPAQGGIIGFLFL